MSFSSRHLLGFALLFIYYENLCKILWVCSWFFFFLELFVRHPKLQEYMLENHLDHQEAFLSNRLLVNGTISLNFWILLWVNYVVIMYVQCNTAFISIVLNIFSDLHCLCLSIPFSKHIQHIAWFFVHFLYIYYLFIFHNKS